MRLPPVGTIALGCKFQNVDGLSRCQAVAQEPAIKTVLRNISIVTEIIKFTRAGKTENGNEFQVFFSDQEDVNSIFSPRMYDYEPTGPLVAVDVH